MRYAVPKTFSTSAVTSGSADFTMVLMSIFSPQCGQCRSVETTVSFSFIQTFSKKGSYGMRTVWLLRARGGPRRARPAIVGPSTSIPGCEMRNSSTYESTAHLEICGATLCRFSTRRLKDSSSSFRVRVISESGLTGRACRSWYKVNSCFSVKPNQIFPFEPERFSDFFFSLT